MTDKIRVLIVDDLRETRENVRKLLQFEPDLDVVDQAENGEEAVDKAQKYRPDIILMDINMPGVDGIGASQTITKAVPESQIIIMSVQSEADYLRRAMLAGARDFLMKPFSPRPSLRRLI
jgi:pilus assembly protein CpaE